jgi:uncharacterized protein (DUF2236 family)
MSILPDPEEYAGLAPRPGSPVWIAFNDVRMLSTAMYALLLQVAHPIVGNGVHQYSSFTTDPWGRLLRTLDYVHGSIYGGPELAGSIGRRVRGMHRAIRGVTEQGRPYRAMEPTAFAWVHATLAAAIFAGHDRLATPMTGEERDLFWAQWVDVGRFIGVRQRDLPCDAAGFDAYFDRVVAEELRLTPAVAEVLASVAAAPPPQIRGLRGRPWRVLAAPLALHLRVISTGLMPAVLRERLELPFSATDRAVFAMACAIASRSGPLIRGPLANFGSSYVRWRHEALARGEVAGGAVTRRALTAERP